MLLLLFRCWCFSLFGLFMALYAFATLPKRPAIMIVGCFFLVFFLLSSISTINLMIFINIEPLLFIIVIIVRECWLLTAECMRMILMCSVRLILVVQRTPWSANNCEWKAFPVDFICCWFIFFTLRHTFPHNKFNYKSSSASKGHDDSLASLWMIDCMWQHSKPNQRYFPIVRFWANELFIVYEFWLNKSLIDIN